MKKQALSVASTICAILLTAASFAGCTNCQAVEPSPSSAETAPIAQTADLTSVSVPEVKRPAQQPQSVAPPRRALPMTVPESIAPQAPAEEAPVATEPAPETSQSAPSAEEKKPTSSTVKAPASSAATNAPESSTGTKEPEATAPSTPSYDDIDYSNMTLEEFLAVTGMDIVYADDIMSGAAQSPENSQNAIINKELSDSEKEAEARSVAREIALVIKNDPSIKTDLERIAYVARFINEFIDAGHTSSFHPDRASAYGTLVAGYSNCAGSTRATGMVLEELGFSWRHVNENQWDHQWCIVYDVDGQTAFCDGSSYGIVGYGSRNDRANWRYLTNSGELVVYDEYFG